MSTFGQRLRAARLEAGMTLQEVADAVGVKNSTVCRYEQDEIRNRKAPVVKAFAEVLNIRVSDLETDGAPVANTLGNLIRARREELGLTQADLAKAVGYTHRSALSKVERGANSLPLTQIATFADALKLPPEKLVCAVCQTDGTEEPAEPRDPTGVSPLGKRIMYRREWLRMSQSELALMTGLPDRESVAKIESGKNQIPVDKVRAFADALKVPVHELIDCNDAEWATFCKVWKLLNE